MKLKKSAATTFLALCLNCLLFNHAFAMSSETASCNQALEKGDVESALTIASKALSKNKNDKEILLCQGRGLAAKEDFNGALTAFKLADQLTTDAGEKAIASFLMGRTYNSNKQFEPAIASYQQAASHAKAAKNSAYERASYNAIGNVHAEKMCIRDSEKWQQ